MNYKLLIVDDEMANLRLLQRLFSSDYQCLTASSGEEAIRVLEQHDVAIVITDQRMPGMTGIELLKRTATLRPHMVRILLTGYTDVEALVEALNSGLVYMYFTKPWNNDDLKLKVSRACEHYENNRKGNSLKMANDRLESRIQAMRHSILAALAEMSMTRSQESYEHSLLVLNCATTIAEKMGLPPEERSDLAAAIMLHELGKNTGLKGSSRRSQSVSVARNHLECEARLLSSMPELGSVADIVTSQNENFDGTGTPTGLRGEQIPKAARVLRVADEYQSLIRPKRSVAAMIHEEAMRFLSQRSGRQFDPAIIDVLQRINPGELSQEFDTSSASSESDRNGTFPHDKFEPSFAESIVN